MHSQSVGIYLIIILSKSKWHYQNIINLLDCDPRKKSNGLEWWGT